MLLLNCITTRCKEASMVAHVTLKAKAEGFLQICSQPEIYTHLILGQPGPKEEKNQGIEEKAQ